MDSACHMSTKHLADSFTSPLISMLSHLSQPNTHCPPRVQFLYCSRRSLTCKTFSILFFDRLLSIFMSDFAITRNKPLSLDRSFKLFLTDGGPYPKDLTGKERLQAIQSIAVDTHHVGDADIQFRRFEASDLLDALGPEEQRGGVVAYVCGPPPMTDWTVAVLKDAEGMATERVLYVLSSTIRSIL